MMRIPVQTLAYWQGDDSAAASPADLVEMDQLAKGKWTADFRAFIATYGFPQWDYAIPDTFDYRIEDAGQVTIHSAAITHLQPPRNLRRMVQNIWRVEPQNGFPMIPQNMMPFAGTAGQDMILMEMEPENGRIWYWPYTNASWGTPGNERLGFVADSFTDFINNLRMGPQPYAD